MKKFFLSLCFLLSLLANGQGPTVLGPLQPNSPTDTYGTHDSRFGIGGFKEVATTAERDAITADRRRAGMWVKVAGGLTYELGTGLTNADWFVVTFGDPLPSQTGHAGKFLTTNGTAASWAAIPIPATPNLQQVTDAGNTTTAGINIASAVATGNIKAANLILRRMNGQEYHLQPIAGGFEIYSANDNAVTATLSGPEISFGYTPGIVARIQKANLTSNATFQLPQIGALQRTFPVSVNGIFADVNGNIPVPAPDLSGYVPTARTLTINGQTFDLAANRSWTIPTPTLDQVATAGNSTAQDLNVGSLNASNSLTAGEFVQSGAYLVGYGASLGSITASLLNANRNYQLPNKDGTFALLSDIPGAVDLSGYVPTARTLTINGQTFDLSANRSWTIAAPAIPTLQQVTEAGAETTLPIEASELFALGDITGGGTVGGGRLLIGYGTEWGPGFEGTISANNLTANRAYQLPNASGTFALLSDIPGAVDISGYVPTSRTLTINGQTFDLSANRSWTIASGDALPSQTGNAGRYLTTNGSAASWTAFPGFTSITSAGDNVARFNRPDGSFTDLTFDFQAPDLSGYVPTARTLTINGQTFDLSANRSWTIAAPDLSGYLTTATAAATYQPLGSYVPTARTLTINGTTLDLSADRSWTISTPDPLPSQTGNAGKFLQTNGAAASWAAFPGFTDIVSAGDNVARFTRPDGSYKDLTFDFQAPDLSGYVPTARTLTINGQTFDLTANRSWTIAAPDLSGYLTTAAAAATYQPLGAYVPTSRTLTINGTTLDLSADRSFTVTGSASRFGVAGEDAGATADRLFNGNGNELRIINTGGLKLEAAWTGGRRSLIDMRDEEGDGEGMRLYSTDGVNFPYINFYPATDAIFFNAGTLEMQGNVTGTGSAIFAGLVQGNQVNIARNGSAVSLRPTEAGHTYVAYFPDRPNSSMETVALLSDLETLTIPTKGTPADPAVGAVVLWFDGTNLKAKKNVGGTVTTSTIF